MAKTDPILGQAIKSILEKKGLETQTEIPRLGDAHESMYKGVLGFLRNMGLDVDSDPSIMDTPNRIAEMFTHELCYGLNYDNFPKCTATPNGVITEHKGNYSPDYDGPRPITQTRTGAIDEMVMVDSIQTVSLCEHHFQTIVGVTHIAYLPGAKLLGLSKFARVTNFFARRPQVQERMTSQIFEALTCILGTEDVAVMQVAVHNCMRARGAMDPTSKTTTSKMGGKFMSVPALRAEFLSRIPQ